MLLFFRLLFFSLHASARGQALAWAHSHWINGGPVFPVMGVSLSYNRSRSTAVMLHDGARQSTTRQRPCTCTCVCVCANKFLFSCSRLLSCIWSVTQIDVTERQRDSDGSAARPNQTALTRSPSCHPSVAAGWPQMISGWVDASLITTGRAVSRLDVFFLGCCFLRGETLATELGL